jgi:4-aminobutyrate aminotransferase-like enzyme
VKSRESKEHDPDLASRVQNAMREDGVLVGMEGKHDNFLKIRPPMPFASQHCEMLLDSMDRAFKREIDH